VLIVAPITVLTVRLGDSVHDFIGGLHNNTLQIPAPPPSVADWPAVGKKVHGLWSQAHSDLPSVIQSLQPKLGDLAKDALGIVAKIGGALRTPPKPVPPVVGATSQLRATSDPVPSTQELL